jgi:hypothetical protein
MRFRGHKWKIGFAIVLLSLHATAGHVLWFTVVGDPSNPDADTIQIDPVARSSAGLRVMEIRTSRSNVRTSQEGVAFRSYEALVEFDCDKATARFLQSQFFDEPLWQRPSRLVQFRADQTRPMDFKLLEPNPRDRVIRAACVSHARSTEASSSKPHARAK